MVSEPAKILRAIVDELLCEKIGVRLFEKKFVDYYNETMPSSSPLTDAEWDFFGDIQDRLTMTAENPDAEDRGYGFINYPEFIAWLRKRYAEFDNAK